MDGSAISLIHAATDTSPAKPGMIRSEDGGSSKSRSDSSARRHSGVGRVDRPTVIGSVKLAGGEWIKDCGAIGLKDAPEMSRAAGAYLASISLRLRAPTREHTASQQELRFIFGLPLTVWQALL
jgi:hypothetical protein